MGQGSRRRDPNAGHTDSLPGQGTKISWTARWDHIRELITCADLVALSSKSHTNIASRPRKAHEHIVSWAQKT